MKSEISDELRSRWAHSDTIARAEFGGKVYELTSDKCVYVLKRATVAPRKAGDSGMLDLVEVIPSPDESLTTKIIRENHL